MRKDARGRTWQRRLTWSSSSAGLALMLSEALRVACGDERERDAFVDWSGNA